MSTKNFTARKDFSRRLKTAMLHKGLTAAALAREADINEGQLSSVLKAQKTLGREATERAAAATGVDIAWLLLGTGKAPAFPDAKSSSVISEADAPQWGPPGPAYYQDAYWRLMARATPAELRTEITRAMKMAREEDDITKRDEIISHAERLLDIMDSHLQQPAA